MTTAAPIVDRNPQALPWYGMTPRQWQGPALQAALRAIDKRTPGVIAATMGSGKSMVIGELAALHRGQVLITTPTVRLVDQLAATVSARCEPRGWTVGRYYTHAKEPDHEVVVCCNASVTACLAAMRKAHRTPQLWIADECHGTTADEMMALAEEIGDCARIGFTATPYRADERERLRLYESTLYEYGPGDALRDGVIVPWRVEHPVDVSLDLDSMCIKWIAAQTQPGVEHPGIVNAVDIEDAEAFATKLNRYDIRAEAVHSRKGRGAADETMASLRAGEIDTVVHVNMLKEGVDYPWLRWLCCRRPVSSRVRFAQEIGRVLRASPGKTEAVIFDPHDLFGALTIDYDAALGWREPPKRTPDDDVAEAIEKDSERDERGRIEVGAAASAAVALWLRRVRLAWAAQGRVDLKVKSTSWRKDAPTDKQLAFARRMWRSAWLKYRQLVPEHVKTGIDAAGASIGAGRFRKGDVSDLIDILITIANAGGWPDPWSDADS